MKNTTPTQVDQVLKHPPQDGTAPLRSEDTEPTATPSNDLIKLINKGAKKNNVAVACPSLGSVRFRQEQFKTSSCAGHVPGANVPARTEAIVVTRIITAKTAHAKGKLRQECPEKTQKARHGKARLASPSLQRASRTLTRREPPPSTESCETAKGEPRSARANVLRVLAVTHKQRVQYKCTARKSWCTCAAFRDTTLPIFSRHCLDGYLLANPACLSSLRLRGAFTRDV